MFSGIGFVLKKDEWHSVESFQNSPGRRPHGALFSPDIRAPRGIILVFSTSRRLFLNIPLWHCGCEGVRVILSSWSFQTPRGTVWHECQARVGQRLSPENSCGFQNGPRPLLPLFLHVISELRLFYHSGGVMLTGSVLFFWAANKLVVCLPRTARFDLMNPVGKRRRGLVGWGLV